MATKAELEQQVDLLVSEKNDLSGQLEASQAKIEELEEASAQRDLDGGGDQDANVKAVQDELDQIKGENETLRERVVELEQQNAAMLEGAGNPEGDPQSEDKDRQVAELTADKQRLEVERDDARNKVIALTERLTRQGSLHGNIADLPPVV